MKCRLCNTVVGKSEYSHARTTKHLKLLKQQMKEKKEVSIKKYGYFKYNQQLLK